MKRSHVLGAVSELAAGGGADASRLAARLALDLPRAEGLVSDLAREGLLERRGPRVTLTAKGESYLRQYAPARIEQRASVSGGDGQKHLTLEGLQEDGDGGHEDDRRGVSQPDGTVGNVMDDALPAIGGRATGRDDAASVEDAPSVAAEAQEPAAVVAASADHPRRHRGDAEPAPRDTRAARRAAQPDRTSAPKPRKLERGLGRLLTWQLPAIRIVMGVAGVGAAIVSGYFNVARLALFMPAGLAAVLGVLMVAFSVVAFEIVIVFLRRRQRALAVLFSGVWLIVWTFTFLATVAGFYGFYSSVQERATVASAPLAAARVRLDAIRSQARDLDRQAQQKEREIADLQRLVSQTTETLGARTANGWVYDDAQARLLSRENQLTAIEDELQAVRDAEAKAVAATPVASEARRPEFYAWVGGMLGISPATLELVTSMFPSTFIDLMAAAGLAVALFLA